MITVLLVTELPGTCPVATQAGLWDRVITRLRSFSLDRDLAYGASPEATVRLALRARKLTGNRERRALARAIRHIVNQAGLPAARLWSPAPVCWDSVRATAAEFTALAGRLDSRAPLAARGVAQVSVLLHDGHGPLYWRGSRQDLAAGLRQAGATLDTLTCW